MEMTRGGMGMTAIVDTDERIIGIYTDGDLRRALEKGCDVRSARVSEVMTRNPRSIAPGALAAEAAATMESMRISQLLVLDQAGRLAGALTTHDLMLAKVI
jgi:arabinose-5-phosphate isomerase